MKKVIPFLLLVIIISSCSRTSNFIKVNYPKGNQSLLNSDVSIYYIKLDTNGVSFHQGLSTQINDVKDIDLDNYLLDKNSEKEFYDSFDLIDENNYGYNSPKEFFVSEYNKIFVQVMQGESLRKTRFAPKKLNIKTIERNIFENSLEKKYIYSPDDSLKVKVYEPNDIHNFCQQIKQKYPDANYIIISGNLYITKDLFERIKNYQHYNPFTGLSSITSSSSKGVIITPEVIIDVNNEQLSGYHIGSNVIDPIIESIRTAIETAFVNDAMELNINY